ncbi:CbtA family protein [Methylosinus sp. Sm6]|uniref:CbtA family protein n=1 Tax=Methylosinus sp. Sm6 TaxID=2866948 RepID=UPI001C997261|nr:CbtA family protein [Methylosinus sp. Sm6]MBY6241064.1 CbtA family protein [Methylosinus sp. Sm6]
MVAKLLLRGMLSGVLAGVAAFLFASLFGEAQIDLAIAFEAGMSKAEEAPEPELVSRAIQSTLGLLTATLAYGAALGGLFALAFAFANGRMGRLDARTTALLLAALGLFIFVIVPALEYPPNPPAVGDPATIGTRTFLHFGMLAVSLLAAVAAACAVGGARRRLGAWNAAILGVGGYIAIMAGVMSILPPIDEVPRNFAATTLWRFRLASLGVNTVLWLTIGLVFGALCESRAPAVET